jgi:hypothetical protein
MPGYKGVFQDGVPVAGGATLSDSNFLAQFGPPVAPAAPVVTVVGATGAVAMGYEFVGVNANGDSLPSVAGTVPNSQASASLTSSNKNTVVGTASPTAVTYKLLRSEAGVAGGAYQLLKSGLNTPNYTDTGADNGGIAAYARALPATLTVTPSKDDVYSTAQGSVRLRAGIPIALPTSIALDIIAQGVGS